MNQAYRKIILIFIFSCLFALPAFAQKDDSIKDIQAHNPDGKKYEFVQSYISSLQYLDQNTQRAAKNMKDLSDTPEGIQAQINLLVNENVSLRVARNLMNNFTYSQNDFMIKIIDQFQNVCDEQIELNNKERDFLKRLYAFNSGDSKELYNREQFVKDLEKLSLDRKESLKSLLKTSVLVSRLMISSKADDKGEYSYLGVTENERKDLLKQLDQFQGEKFSGELREGQSFLEGSVTVIRQVLQDPARPGLKGGVY